MANQLYQEAIQRQSQNFQNNIFGPFGNAQNLMQQINNARQKLGGDPNEHIQTLLNNGVVTQEQYNAASQQANMIMQMMGRRGR